MKFAAVRIRLRLVTGKRPNGTLEVEAKTTSGLLGLRLILTRKCRCKFWDQKHEAMGNAKKLCKRAREGKFCVLISALPKATKIVKKITIKVLSNSH